MADYAVLCYTQISLLQGKRCCGTPASNWLPSFLLTPTSYRLPPYTLKWVIPHRGVYCHRHRSAALVGDMPQYPAFTLSF